MKHVYVKATLLVLVLLSLCIVGTIVTIFASPNRASDLFAVVSNRSPNEAIRYVERRLIGHDKLQVLLVPPLKAFQRRLERATGDGRILTLGKGQQTTGLAKARKVDADIVVSTGEQLILAVRDAKPGITIEVAPGVYKFANRVQLGNAGTSDFPVTIRAAIPGTSILEFSSQEGFLVAQPYWVFDGLVIRGTCRLDKDCEHAFHVVGAGHHTTIRNNYLENFNAHIKVNGFGGVWPDHGLVSFNTMTNTHPRQTVLPVTPFDLVGASHWRFQDNLVTNFTKQGGNNVAFGIFMKGASEGGRIERNLVICSLSEISRPGARVGISFGGGGSFPKNICRDGSCKRFEHSHGMVANNVVAHCNDAGIDINNSANISVYHNTLINTSGIEIRQAPAEAHLHGNIYEGGIRVRDRATLKQDKNQAIQAVDVFQNPALLNLEWRKQAESVPSTVSVPKDFCDRPRASITQVGALATSSTCKTTQLEKYAKP